ncbi:Formin-like protein 6 [Ceratobasidium sp. AG-Ba]|nr:Formin-like protein 6 [Ceratobasidium sp. AG-Ba]QRW08728.1 Formin-like protein 6 [Ceratobasidium sp. AG-Ba]
MSHAQTKKQQPPVEEPDPSRELPSCALTRFFTEVLWGSLISINALQVALAYLAGAKSEVHNQLCITADPQHALAIQIAAQLSAGISGSDGKPVTAFVYAYWV